MAMIPEISCTAARRGPIGRAGNMLSPSPGPGSPTSACSFLACAVLRMRVSLVMALFPSELGVAPSSLAQIVELNVQNLDVAGSRLEVPM